MAQSATGCELDKEDSPGGTDGAEGTAGAATLFDEGREVRVSEIVGDLPVPGRRSLDTTPASLSAPRHRGLGLRLDWYDCGIVALLVASLVVAALCLLKGG